LLTGLPTSVEGARYLRAAEGAVVELAAVFAGKRHPLRDTLVNDVQRDFGQSMHVGFARAEVAPFDRIVEQAVYRIAVPLIILRCVDAPLSGDRVGASGGIVKYEIMYVVAEFGQRGSSRSATQSSTDHDDLEFSLI